MKYYHGGASPDFNIDSIDLYRKATKQQKKGGEYVGFYMYDEKYKYKTINYAEMANKEDSGILEIDIKDDAKIVDYELGSIDRIKKEQLEVYQNQGYDLLRGKSILDIQYVLLNKDVINSINYKSLKEFKVEKMVDDMAKGIDVLNENTNTYSNKTLGNINSKVLLVLSFILIIALVAIYIKLLF